ncbi:hypothetical protein H6F75_00375 [Nodosilinea sp. FACHB-131]|uniref:hypothetical protein n=1 Tax=Cyanophyceae TaxID=3028117 RepID=UPI0016842B8B|nr:hypothetical protein [Nodosilinea sp. FACHB-131]MBD1871925.1 hypothetical protein [Nodosilinea sp. FACHB-131]
MAARIDWSYWRHKYVTGDDSVTHEALSRIPNAPALITLKKRSALESWTKQRDEFRLRKHTVVSSDPAAIAAAEKVNQLVDIAAMVTQHDKIGRALEGVAGKWLKQFEENPELIKKMPARDIATLLRIGLDTRRMAAGLATQHQEIDLSGLSDKALERILKGDV